MVKLLLKSDKNLWPNVNLHSVSSELLISFDFTRNVTMPFGYCVESPVKTLLCSYLLIVCADSIHGHKIRNNLKH